VVVDAALEEGMRRMGASEAEIEKVRRERGTAGAQDPNVCWVLDENWTVWQFYLKGQTQWVYAGGGMAPPMRVAMDYPGMESVARIRGVPGEQLQAWADDLHTIELAVLEADNELALKRRRK